MADEEEILRCAQDDSARTLPERHGAKEEEEILRCAQNDSARPLPKGAGERELCTIWGSRCAIRR